MAATALPIFLGSFLIVICLVAIILNSTVLYVLYKGKFLASGCSTVYLFAFANICGNILMLSFFGFYYGPTLIIQDFLFPGGKDNFFSGFMGFLIHGQWCQDLLIHDASSFNRLITVVYPKTTFLTSKKTTIGIIIFVFFLGFFLAWLANYYLPCCQFYLYPGILLNMPQSTGYNVANIFVSTPFNFIASGFAVINYVIIFIFVRVSNRKIAQTVNKSVQKTRKTQEIKYAIQFSLCTCFCIITWVSVRLFAFMGIRLSFIYLILVVISVFHASTNAIVFLIFNKEFQGQFKLHILRQEVTKVTSIKIPHSRTNVHTLPKVISL